VYYNDTATHRVDVFDYDRDGGLTGQRTFAAIPDGGRPDGLTVDEQGGVWVVLSNRGVVWHFTAEGMHDEVVDVPASKVTACTLGGPTWTNCSSRHRGRTSSRAATRWPARCSGRRWGTRPARPRVRRLSSRRWTAPW
jgi:sugar lactone lactonase YvrE